MTDLASPNPNPDRDELDDLLIELFNSPLPAFSLSECYHKLCDRGSSGRERVRAREDAEELECIQDAFGQRVRENVEQDKWIHPERVAERVLMLEPRIIGKKDSRGVAFLAEINNNSGEWLLFANLQCFRYSSPAAMRISSSHNSDNLYSYEALFSPEAFEEDLKRLEESGAEAFHVGEPSYVLFKAITCVRTEEGNDNEIFIAPSQVRIERAPQAVTVFLEAPSGNWYAVAVERDEDLAILRVECKKCGTPADIVTSEKSVYDRAALKQKYLSLCEHNARFGGGALTSEADVVTSIRLKEAVKRRFGKLQNSLELIFQEPYVAASREGRVISWLLYCLDSSGKTNLPNHPQPTPYAAGPVAARISCFQGKEDEYRVEPLYSRQAFEEELSNIARSGASLLYASSHPSWILDAVVHKVSLQEKRQDILDCRAVRRVRTIIGMDGDAVLAIETDKSKHLFSVKLDSVTNTLLISRL